MRALRGEEDAGRFELLLAGPMRRGEATAAVLVALGAECVVLWAATALALIATGTAFGDVSLGQSLLLGVAIVAPGALFAAVGALVCQVAPTHRGAQALGGALVALFLLLPVTGSRPAVPLLFAVVTTLAAWATLVAARRRDVATGLVRGGHAPRSRRGLLGSPLQAALRGEAPTLATWVAGAGIFAGLIGAFSKSIAEEARKANLHSTLGTDYTTPGGYLALTFVFFALVVALFAASHLNGIRDEEGSGRLETLLALPVDRARWLVGRVAIAAVASMCVAVMTGVLAWAGAATQDAGVALSPFHHVAAVPVARFDAAGAAIMLVLAAAAAASGVAVFARRDLQTS